MADQIPDSAKSVTQTDSEFLHDMAARVWRFATPNMGFDQGDTDRLYRIARDISRAAPPAMDREAVEKLVEPWADYHGDLPDYDHSLRPVFESGIQYAVELLAKELGVKEWEPCDGTEEFDGDLGGTLMNIVLEAMPKDEDGDPIHPRDLLSTLSAGAIRQGEGFKWPEPKFVPVESGAKLNPERVEAAFQLINGEMVIGEQFRLIEMMLDGTEYTIAPATPASHASDGGKA